MYKSNEQIAAMAPMFADIINRYHGTYEGIAVTIKGQEMSGFAFGDDECFDPDGYYMWFIAEEAPDRIYRLYYDLTDEYGEQIEIDEVDPENPCMIEDCTDEMKEA